MSKGPFGNIKTVSWVDKDKTEPPRLPSLPSKKKYTFSGFFHNISDVLFDEENISARITDTYENDYDIINVHKIILSKFEKEKREIDSLILKKNQMEEKLKEKLKIVERKKLVLELESLIKKIENIKNDINKKEYLEKVCKYIDKYQEMEPVIKKKSFIENKNPQESNNKEIEERVIIIKKYLDIAKKYIPINVIRIISQDQTCSGCGGTNIISEDPEDNSLLICKDCGYEKLNFGYVSSIRENNSSNKTPSNSDYEDKENFIKALECYLGEQPKPPENLFISLDNWAYKYNHPSKEEIAKLPLNTDGTRGVYGKEMLIQALGDEGYADYYKDWKLIGHIHWGWELPKISQQERNIIISDYDKTQKIFDKIKGDRKSSMNSQLRLYRHLEARGITCHQSDFKLPTTPSILEEQDNYWKEMIKAIPEAKFRSMK